MITKLLQVREMVEAPGHYPGASTIFEVVDLICIAAVGVLAVNQESVADLCLRRECLGG